MERWLECTAKRLILYKNTREKAVNVECGGGLKCDTELIVSFLTVKVGRD